ncbi:MAG: hypothetical protein LPH21_09695 [Shewanella sp.]|nr:hypothetical protein [Shewanella sp.]
MSFEIYEGAIVHQVFLAVDGEGMLPINESILLESLCDEDDGIFPTERSWKAFCNGNFGDRGSLYLEGVPSSNFVKKYCYPAKDFLDKFVQRVNGKWVKVDPKLIKLTYTYDLNIYRRDGNFPCQLEVYVTASYEETL